MGGTWQVEMGLATTQHTDPEVGTAGKKNPTWLLPLLCFSELPQAGRRLSCPVQTLRFRHPDAGVDSGCLFTWSYYFGLRPGLFADGASKHMGGVICQQWVACRELGVFYCSYKCILNKWHLGLCMGSCSLSDLCASQVSYQDKWDKTKSSVHYKTLAHGGGCSWVGKEMRIDIFQSLSEGVKGKLGKDNHQNIMEPGDPRSHLASVFMSRPP